MQSGPMPEPETRVAWHVYAAEALGLFAPEMFQATHPEWVNCTTKGQMRGRGGLGLKHDESGTTIMFFVGSGKLSVENPQTSGAVTFQRRMAASVGYVRGAMSAARGTKRPRDDTFW